MMRCPLPIDWLECLEGAASDELEAHLSKCRPCQVLVEELRRDSRPSLHPANLPKPESWPRWNETHQAAPTCGEIWWTRQSLGSADDDLPRVPVLVISEVWPEKGSSWCELVPLSSDIENATSLDLVMLRSDTDMNVRWRALLRHQTIGATSDLETRIGQLTAQGETLVKNVIEGRAPADRFGSPIDGAEDSRVRAPQEVDRAMRLIGCSYAELLTDREQAKPARVLAFPMRPAVAHGESAAGPLSLAASTDVEHETTSWSVDIPQRGRVHGRVDHRYLDDELVFVVEDITEEPLGFGATAWIAFWSDRLAAPVTSVPFDPKRDHEVSISKGLEVFPQEITRLEFRLPDEA